MGGMNAVISLTSPIPGLSLGQMMSQQLLEYYQILTNGNTWQVFKIEE